MLEVGRSEFWRGIGPRVRWEGGRIGAVLLLVLYFLTNVTEVGVDIVRGQELIFTAC